MKEESLNGSSIIKFALLRAYESLDASTQALLGVCQLMVARNQSYWYITFAAPNPAVWKRIVKRLESITRRFDRTLSSFILVVCTIDDLAPPGGQGIGIVKRLFQINKAWFVQVSNEAHPHWMQVIPKEALTRTQPPQVSRNDEEDDLELPF